MIDDIRLAWRRLRRRPGFTLVAAVTLGLGIGAATALFSVVNGVLLRPLPFPEPDELHLLYSAYPQRGSTRGTLSLPDFRDWAERSRTVEQMGLFTTLPSDLVLSRGEGASEIHTAYVSWELLPTAGVPPTLGRPFREDDETGNPFVVVLGHGLWTREFGGDSSVVGRTVTLSDKSFEVIGVMPPGFGFPSEDVEAWVLLATIRPEEIPLHLRFVRLLNALGRLAPGVTMEQARSELSAIAANLSREHPDANDGLEAVELVALREAVVGNVETALLVLFGAVGLVLLIASVNVANLLLAQGVARRREVALRSALGARRSRVVRTLLTESLLLGLLGCAIGVVLAYWGVDLVVATSAGTIPRTGETRPDRLVLAFAAVVSALTVALSGLAPAWSMVSSDPARRIIEDGDRATTRSRGRRGLVVAEVALAMVLLVAAGLLVRSLRSLATVDPGFQPRGALAVTMTFRSSRYPDRAEYLGQHDRVLEAFRAIPGVRAAGSIRYLPMRGTGEQSEWRLVGEPPGRESEREQAQVLQVTPELFRALGVSLIAGRAPSDADPRDTPVVVVNEAFRRQAFRGEDGLGRTVQIVGLDATIIGVVGDVRQQALEDLPVPTVYVPLHQVPRRSMSYVLRTDGDAISLAGAVRRAVQAVDPDQAISELTPLDAVVYGSIARPRFFALLLSVFAATALSLAAVGIYGVLAYMVRARTREIGVRMALGADRGHTLRLVVRQGMRPVLVGLAIGGAAAAGLTTVMTSMLFQVHPLDPPSYVGGAALLATVACAACLVPAWRAMKVPPVEALRHE